MKYSVYKIFFLILPIMLSFCTYGQKAPSSNYHIVKSYENVFRISLHYKVSVDSIHIWNNLNQNYTVRVGQKLIVSSRKSILPPFQSTTEKGLVHDADTSKNHEKSQHPASLITDKKNATLSVRSATINKNIASDFFEKVMYYYHNSSFFFRMILFMNLVFMVFISVLFNMILYRRLRHEYVQFQRKKCQDRFRDYITDWLYEVHSERILDSLKKELKGWVKREVFTSELLSLHANLTGESADKLIDLFHLAGLRKYSMRKVHSPFWHVKAKGFRELAQMKIKDGNNIIFKCLNSRNVILHIEAQMAWIQLNPDDPLSFFDDDKVELTDWGLLNSLISLKKINAVPDFRRWLPSLNKSVALFALKMSGVFKQYDNIDLVTLRIEDDDVDIRHEAICALGKMAVESPGARLRQQFSMEGTGNKTEIIRSLIMMSDTSNIPFFEKVLLSDTDNYLRILSAKGLVSLEGIGSVRLDSLYQDADQVLKNIIIHAKDDRI